MTINDKKIQRGLIITPRWLEKILSGEKTLEMRTRPTKIRGWIALIESGAGLIMGITKLVSCTGPMTLELLQKCRNAHCIDYDQQPDLERYKFAWTINFTQKLESPIPYRHPKGAIIWVKL